MAVEYDFYQTPVPENKEQQAKYHARVVNLKTTDTTELAKEIHNRCSLAVGDVKATLEELSDVMAKRLANGERIHIKGLGYFQMTIKCPPVENIKKIRAETIELKSIVFRPEIEFRKALSGTAFKRVSEKKHTKNQSNEEIDELLTRLFSENEFITRVELEKAAECTRSQAIRQINRLIEEGKLLKKGYNNAPVYFPAPGIYGN